MDHLLSCSSLQTVGLQQTLPPWLPFNALLPTSISQIPITRGSALFYGAGRPRQLHVRSMKVQHFERVRRDNPKTHHTLLTHPDEFVIIPAFHLGFPFNPWLGTGLVSVRVYPHARGPCTLHLWGSSLLRDPYLICLGSSGTQLPWCASRRLH